MFIYFFRYFFLFIYNEKTFKNKMLLYEKFPLNKANSILRNYN